MNKRKFIIIIIVGLMIIIGGYCIYRYNVINYFKYTKSLQTWNELKNKNGNSYSYESSFQSWIGYSNVTKIIVKDGIPVSREYKESMRDVAEEDKNKLISFIENITNLNSHNEGELATTIDKKYKQCIREYLSMDKVKNEIYFETEKNGMMSFCGYYPKGCMDDCTKGIRIENFQWIK